MDLARRTLGLGDQNFRDLYLHLMSGLIESDPDRALDVYAGTSGNLRDSTNMFDLGQFYAKQMVEQGNDSGMRRLLALTDGPARERVVTSAAQVYASAGRLNEALAFADQHKPASGNDGLDDYVLNIARIAPQKVALDTSLDWLLANISKPEAATLTVMRMLYRYDEFGWQDQAMRWLDRQPSGQVRDAAHVSLVWQQTMGAKYDAALEGASKIDDPSVRSQMVKIIEDSRQLHKDTGGARNVFQTSDTPWIKF